MFQVIKKCRYSCALTIYNQAVFDFYRYTVFVHLLINRKITALCLTNPFFSAIMTTTMINAVKEIKSPFPLFRELPVGARRYWGSDSWLLSSPPKGYFFLVGRDGILPLQGWVFAVMDKYGRY